LQFEVNGQTYFLNYFPAEGWALLAPTPQGIRQMRVVNDDAVDLFSLLMLGEDEDGKPAN